MLSRANIPLNLPNPATEVFILFLQHVKIPNVCNVFARFEKGWILM